MNKSSLLKFGLAVGILTTTGNVLENQEASAASTQYQNYNNLDLYSYYTQRGTSISNLEVYKENNNVLEFLLPGGPVIQANVTSGFYNSVTEGQGKYDVFVVNETTNRGTVEINIGGVTKSGKLSNPKSFKINIKNDKNPLEDLNINIDKEEISLKELDFIIRKKLIENKGLYKDGVNGGKITIQHNGDEKNKNTFELHKKLQEHRMSDVIKTESIKGIEVVL